MSLKFGQREDIPSVINCLSGTYKNNNKYLQKESQGLKRLLNV